MHPLKVQSTSCRLNLVLVHLALVSGVRKTNGGAEVVEEAVEQIKGLAFTSQLLLEICIVLGSSERNYVVVAAAHLYSHNLGAF